MNWGYGITILTLGFVLFMCLLAGSAYRQSFDLVAEDYYGKELRYEEQIKKQERQGMLKEKIVCTQDKDNIRIQFPPEVAGKKVEGVVLFFRPSDALMDRSISLHLNDGFQVFSKKAFPKGFYKVQIDYSADTTLYYFEDAFMIN